MHYRLAQARLDGEAAWARQLLEGLRAGEYWFEGEPDAAWHAVAGGLPAERPRPAVAEKVRYHDRIDDEPR